jgi:hypothetical protein
MINIQAIPNELRQVDQWVNWKWEERPDRNTGQVKLAKPPYQPNGQHAETDNPDTWSTFEQTVQASEQGRFSGIGIVVTDDDQLAGVDLDHCREPETGDIEDWAEDIVRKLNSYTEVSPSGTGLRIFFYAKLPPRHRRIGNFECYDSGRYLTVTGNHLAGTPSSIERRQGEMDAVHAEMFAERDRPRANGKISPPSALPNLDDEEILHKAFNAKNGDAIWRLFHGDTGGYGSHSEADMALCGYLAFYAGPDPQKIDRLYQASDLVSPKWDDPRGDTTWGRMTIDKVLDGKTEFYSPNGHHKNGNSPVPEPLPAPSEWGPLQPFESVEVPEFPVDALPSDVAEYASQEAEAKQVPVDLPGCLILGGLAAAAGGKCNVYLSPDWQEPVNQYIVSVLPSGERKSPLFRSILKPLEDVEKELVAQQTPEILRQKTERDILEKRWQNAKTDAAKGKGDARITAEAEAHSYVEELAHFTVPEMPRLLADDATPEAVAGLLAEQKGRLAIASTEGGIFDIVGGRYSDSTPNLDVYLKAYCGDTVRVDRRSRPPEFVSNPTLTVILTVQPDVISDLASKKAFRGRRFLARWLYSLPKSKVGYRNIDAPSVAEEVRQMWGSLLRQILLLPVPEPDKLPLISLSAEARALFREFRQEVEIELRPGEELDDLADWGNKLSGNVARLAGLLHIAEWARNSMNAPTPWDSPISVDTMREAIALGKYFEGHAKAAFALMGSDGKLQVAKKVWGVITRHQLKTFKASILWMRHLRRSFSKPAAFEDALNTLVELGYIRQVATPRREGPGQPPSPTFEVNPLACSMNSKNSMNSGADAGEGWEEEI